MNNYPEQLRKAYDKGLLTEKEYFRLKSEYYGAIEQNNRAEKLVALKYTREDCDPTLLEAEHDRWSEEQHSRGLQDLAGDNTSGFSY